MEPPSSTGASSSSAIKALTFSLFGLGPQMKDPGSSALPLPLLSTFVLNMSLASSREEAAPKRILEPMNVPGLTRENVASHLQIFQSCDNNSATGADHVSQVSHAIGKDSRIGPKFLNASVVANYWKQVIKVNDYQKNRFVNRVVSSMFNTVSGKKIAIMGFAFKKDTGDTRETPAIDVCKGLLGDKARLSIYDPQVTEDQIQRDLSMNKFDWDHPIHLQPMSPTVVRQSGTNSKTLDYQRIFDNMQKPAFVFDGRNLVNVDKLREIGFIVYSIGKLLDAWLKDMPAMA
ncbi:hypothetical protein COLO4_07297 [Corchorus olitorius]|uniref:UDP-glucose/GDP-mannose dehydrogenase C-terminal domain-containing protein n=1 Tax=Corchorus olitorius TaxID=93759 RepID=A0A1R3KKA8_9ROSI|nr:hypothetical protein COLO4_07297 [Corchorus olitorius]